MSQNTIIDWNKKYTGKILVDLAEEKCGVMQIEYLDTNEESEEIKIIDTISLP